MKKKIIISIGIILLISLLIGSFWIIKSLDKNTEKFDTKVISMITLDINPSIKIELNKDNNVVNVIAINDDAKEIIEDNYIGKSLEEVINKITDKLLNKDYIDNKLFILLGVSGQINKDEVKGIIDNKLTSLNIEYNLIIPEINENSKELAKKYNITESKAAYIEEITNKYSEIQIEEILETSINNIVEKTIEIEKNIEQEQITNNITNNTNNTNNTGGGYGTLNKCDTAKSILTNEEAGKKVASFMGASIGTGRYCDKLPPESVMVVTSDNVCAYKVSFSHKTKSCVYYINVETGNVIGEPSCTSKLVEEGEAQCIIMESMGITKREQFYAKNNRDNGSEWIYDVEDVYGTPDAEGKLYIYEYHVSKYTGQITSKNIIEELH